MLQKQNLYNKIFSYNVYYRHEWVRKMASQVSPGSVVLDAGAGRGNYRELFSHCSYKTQDFGQELETIGEYTKLDYECDITSIPVAEATFDVVICTEVMEHLPEPIEALREFSRILKPGGNLFITVPLLSRLHQEPFHFYGGLTSHWFEKFLPEYGFEPVEILKNQGFFSFFGQEGQYFHSCLNPKNYPPRDAKKFFLLILWLGFFPLFRWIIPFLAFFLDSLNLDKTCTAGYFVHARKKAA